VYPSSGRGEYWPEGPVRGAQFHYTLAEAPDDAVTLDVLDQQGTVLRSFTSDSTAAEENEDLALIPAEAGMNHVAWDMMTEGVDTPEGAIVWGYTGGVKVVPGTYQVRLTVGDDSQTRSFEVLKDPRLTDVTQADLMAQHQMATTIRDTLQSVYDGIHKLRSVRDQVHSVAKYAEEAGLSADISTQADTVASKLSDLETELIQVQAESFQDVINYPPKLDNQYAYLYGYVTGPNGAPTEGARVRFSDLNDQWTTLHDRLQTILNTDVAQFNQMVQQAGGTQPILVPATSDADTDAP
jgi:DNA-binding FrmR family transcriptional regulator